MIDSSFPLGPGRRYGPGRVGSGKISIVPSGQSGFVPRSTALSLVGSAHPTVARFPSFLVWDL
ncbi:hypothetical protein [Phormidium sp. FACHB-77]|uniref:hypothetical protein n=1 Tax=Cyanophyceae TaxID=3028117 RepID=UPI0016825E47|nr:hypothetical protein [Phormidium sp. FACHB-77]MBD1918524.1 hypothetical protein [Phormidium sp. FACHB-77]MBD2031413.1 hypothetical protein [Phormidium sp. FACHB-322]